MTIDLATGFYFFGLAGGTNFFGASGFLVYSASPKRSSSAAFGAYFFSYFLAGFFPLKALCASFGRSFDPIVLSAPTMVKYQLVRFL
jgi:hypothetical protein